MSRRTHRPRERSATSVVTVGLVGGTLVLSLGCASAHRVHAGRSGGPGGDSGHNARRSSERYVEHGKASWYGPDFDGRPTASGEVFDMDRPSAAHRTLPFGTVVRVENLDNGREALVRINDRGPFVRGRILDLSRAAARDLGMIGAGIARIKLTVVHWPTPGGTPELADRGIQRAALEKSEAPLFWLQLGAFRDRKRAQALAARLRDLDKRIAVYSEDGWHRVQLRARLGALEVETLRQRLAERGVDAVSFAAK